jgi:hypothetical protein
LDTLLQASTDLIGLHHYAKVHKCFNKLNFPGLLSFKSKAKTGDIILFHHDISNADSLSEKYEYKIYHALIKSTASHVGMVVRGSDGGLFVAEVEPDEPDIEDALDKSPQRREGGVRIYRFANRLWYIIYTTHTHIHICFILSLPLMASCAHCLSDDHISFNYIIF